MIRCFGTFFPLELICTWFLYNAPQVLPMEILYFSTEGHIVFMTSCRARCRLTLGKSTQGGKGHYGWFSSVNKIESSSIPKAKSERNSPLSNVFPWRNLYRIFIVFKNCNFLLSNIKYLCKKIGLIFLRIVNFQKMIW